MAIAFGAREQALILIGRNVEDVAERWFVLANPNYAAGGITRETGVAVEKVQDRGDEVEDECVVYSLTT